MSTEYNELLKSPKWRLKREIILKRDGYQCKWCKAKFQLQVHHKQYHHITSTGEFASPWSYNDKYLITLCNDCHSKGHQNYTVPTFKI